MSDLKLTLSNVTSFLPNNLSGLQKKIIFRLGVITKQRSATVTISTNLFFVLGMTPNCANTISKHGS